MQHRAGAHHSQPPPRFLRTTEPAKSGETSLVRFRPAVRCVFYTQEVRRGGGLPSPQFSQGHRCRPAPVSPCYPAHQTSSVQQEHGLQKYDRRLSHAMHTSVSKLFALQMGNTSPCTFPSHCHDTFLATTPPCPTWQVSDV